MASVNHKKIKQLIAQRQKSFTDRQFFTSRILAGHFADMAAAQTRRYGVRRKVQVRIVWEPKNSQVACTNNALIWINAGHKSITVKRSREERYELVCGYFVHELGHTLYTDFLSPALYGQYFQSERWYPEPPPLKTREERMNEADIRFFCKDNEQRTAMFLRMAFHLSNILEDGYIEGKMLNRYPGVLGSNLAAMREDHFEELPTLTQLIEKESDDGGHIWLTLQNLLLSYALYGELKYGDEPLTDERVQMVFSMLNELDAAVTEPSTKDRWHATNIIIIRCWEYIKDFLEQLEQQAEDAAVAGGGSSAAEALSELLASIKGTSSEGTGDTEPVEETGGDASTTPGKSRRQATAKLAASAKPPESEEEESEGGAGAGSEDDEDKPDESEDETIPVSGSEDESEDESQSGASGDDTGDSENITPGGPPGEQPPSQNVSSEEGGRIPLTQTDRVHNPSDGETTTDDEYEGSGNTNAAADVERLLEKMAERAVHTDLEKERKKDLNELAQNISYGNIHEGVNMKVHRIAEVSDDLQEAYASVAGPLLHISKLLQRSIKQQLQDKRSGGKQTGLLMGRRLDSHALSRNDGRVFYKNALPNNTPEISIGLLLDESGSMSWGDRATYARAAAIILYDFCKALDIPVMVYGHSTGYNEVDLYSYAEFEAIDRNDCYRLMDISARSSNRDGAALRYVAERLSKRHEDIRILILVSDGQPADSGYSGTAAEEDLRGIKHEYARKGILFVAAAIGSDKENIERIYGDAFLDITDLTKLPVALTSVVKRHIRV